MARLLLSLLPCLLTAAALNQSDSWVQLVDPLLSKQERARYMSLSTDERTAYQQQFWLTWRIGANEYMRRTAYADLNFGSGKAGSGANTDQGRVYISLGAPNKVTRVASSRTFVPLEIWYYSDARQTGAPSELRLVFFSRTLGSLPRLYSPVTDTIRALLNPQPGIRGLFGPNETADINAMRERLNASPVEMEVLDAAAAVAQGVTGSENDRILAQALSPASALRREPGRVEVRSRIVERSKDLVVFQSPSPYGGTQVDIEWRGEASATFQSELLDKNGSLRRDRLTLPYQNPRQFALRQRFDLLPGDYSLIIQSAQGPIPYPIHIDPGMPVPGAIRCSITNAADRMTPFQFQRRLLVPDRSGSVIAVSARPGTPVSWVVRNGRTAVSKGDLVSDGVMTIDIAPYLAARREPMSVDIAFDGFARTLALAPAQDALQEIAPVISFNANLSPAVRLSFLGQQHLRRHELSLAEHSFTAALNIDSTDSDALVGTAQLQAERNDWDGSRQTLQRVLAANPRHQPALALMAGIEAQLQDYSVAASYYRRALAVADDPLVRSALASLPAR